MSDTHSPRPQISEPLGRHVDDVKIESQTQLIGRRLFAGMKRHEPPPWKSAGMENMVMKLFMQDEDLRYRMLQFVDVYPSLKTSRAVAEHLEEYLTADEMGLAMGPGRLGRLARSLGRNRSMTRSIIAWATGFSIRRMGRQFIAGNTPEEVAPKIASMERSGFLFTLDLLGEFVASESQADHFARRYLDMIERFDDLLGPRPHRMAHRRTGKAGPRVNISIKLSSLTSKFDPMDVEGTSAAVRRRLRPLFRAAQHRGVFLNIDMEKFEYRDTTLQIILDLLDEREFHGFPQIGTVVQAYLKDAHGSLEWFLGELHRRRQPMTIRLVKGAYWDSEQIWARQRGWPVPVITKKHETDAMYERCARLLLEQPQDIRTAIASHNVRSIAHSLALREALRVGWDRFEIQMLYGMAGPIKEALVERDVPLRIYVPCGELIPGMSYLARRILENTSNESFLRQRFAERRQEDELLADPKRHYSEDNR